MDVAVLDFSKAFDTVPHRELLHKLDHYGVRGPLHSWLSTFLTQRSMKVVLEGESSDAVAVESGVPQGTVLGPILFLCHINDLPSCVESEVRLFADDCLLYRQINTLADHTTLQNDLTKLEQWAQTWGMRFNAKKCYILSTTSRSSHFYSLNNTILQQVSSIPYLGVQISDDLKWNTHIDSITKRASSTLGFVRRNLRSCPEHCRRTAYTSLIRPSLEYAASVWDPHTQTEIDRLEKVQRRAARFIKNDYCSRTPGCVTTMLSDLKLPPLQLRRQQLRLSFFYKVVEGLVPAMPPAQFLSPVRASKRLIKAKTFQGFQTTNIISKHQILNSRGFQIFPTQTDTFEHSFFPRTTRDWNQLSDDIVCAPSIDAFRTRLQQ